MASAAAVKDDSMNGPRKHETHKQHSMGNEVILNAAIHGHGEERSRLESALSNNVLSVIRQAPRSDESLFCEI